MIIKSPALVWSLKDDVESKSYKRMYSMRTGRTIRVILVTVPLGLLLLLIFASIHPVGFFVPIVLAIAISMYSNWSLAKLYPRNAVALYFVYDRLILSEDFSERGVRGSIRALHYQANYITSAIWVSEGCWVELKPFPLLERGVLLPLGLFKKEGAVEMLYDWAGKQGIEIEGNPPLGAYQRPIRQVGAL